MLGQEHARIQVAFHGNNGVDILFLAGYHAYPPARHIEGFAQGIQFQAAIQGSRRM
jgi:hypothetical protein